MTTKKTGPAGAGDKRREPAKAKAAEPAVDTKKALDTGTSSSAAKSKVAAPAASAKAPPKASVKPEVHVEKKPAPPESHVITPSTTSKAPPVPPPTSVQKPVAKAVPDAPSIPIPPPAAAQPPRPQQPISQPAPAAARPTTAPTVQQRPVAPAAPPAAARPTAPQTPAAASATQQTRLAPAAAQPLAQVPARPIVEQAVATKPAVAVAVAPAKPKVVLEVPQTLTVKQFADMLNISGVEVIKNLMRNGVMASINQVIDYDTAAVVAVDLGVEVKEAPKPVEDTQAVIEPDKIVEQDPTKLKPRPPVVTILGHVDHGKTTLLDAIRKTNVTASEAGGITQHIGAYQIEVNGQKITFLDTPGHEAFTSMRARGAKATDIAVLVVAADDGVMPQTVEAINHARAANVPILVAINKIDKPGATPERIMQQLSDYGVLVEKWGGDVISVPVSAKMNTGINDLLDNILVLAEVQQLKANPDRAAAGVVIEAELSKTKGPLATVLVQAGTLNVGDTIVAGASWGRIKALTSDTGRRVKSAPPAFPVEVLGMSSVPRAGDTFMVVKDEKAAKDYTSKYVDKDLKDPAASRPVTLEDVFAQIKAGQVKELNLILKTDVQGSIEPIRTSLEKLSSEISKVKIIHTGTGSITDTDVLLAIASRAIILGFNSKVEAGASHLAETEGVDIRLYDIIYKMVEDIQKALEGLLEAKIVDVIDGHSEVRQVFPLGKKGTIAGVFVRDGKVNRNSLVRVIRGGKALFEGPVSQLKRFKDDVTEVTTGLECGIYAEGFSEYQTGDVIESFHKEKAGRPVRVGS